MAIRICLCSRIEDRQIDRHLTFGASFKTILYDTWSPFSQLTKLTVTHRKQISHSANHGLSKSPDSLRVRRAN